MTTPTRLWIMLTALVFLLIGLGIEKAFLFAQTERARRMAERELAAEVSAQRGSVSQGRHRDVRAA